MDLNFTVSFPFSYLIHVVELVQTIPANDVLVCPGRTLQYTCTPTINSSLIVWRVNDDMDLDGEMDPVVLDEINKNGTSKNFIFEITSTNKPHLISTATNKMILSDQDSNVLYCFSETMSENVTIDIAGR